MHLSCRLLFDLAARVQDLLLIHFNSFLIQPNGSGKLEWAMHKQNKQERFGHIEVETMKLVKTTMVLLKKNPTDPLFP